MAKVRLTRRSLVVVDFEGQVSWLRRPLLGRDDYWPTYTQMINKRTVTQQTAVSYTHL